MLSLIHISVVIGGGLGGLFGGLMGVKSYAPVTLFGITSFLGNNEYMNFYCAVGAVVVGFIAALVAAYILGIPQENEEPQAEILTHTNSTFTKSDIKAPLKGRSVALAKIKDKAFSTGEMCIRDSYSARKK